MKHSLKIITPVLALILPISYVIVIIPQMRMAMQYGSNWITFASLLFPMLLIAFAAFAFRQEMRGGNSLAAQFISALVIVLSLLGFWINMASRAG